MEAGGGMRVRVTDILDLLAAGVTADQMVKELPDMELADVYAALQFDAQCDDLPASSL
jgi:uncharacterized protein (DUF433 family)